MNKELYANENDELEFILLPVLLNKIMKKLQKLSDNILKPYGLSKFHYIYLLCLYKRLEGLNLTELTDFSGYDKANTTRVVNDLEKKNLLFRDKTTEKKYNVKLTDDGYKIGKMLYEKTLQFKDRVFGDLSEQNINRLLVLANKVFMSI